MQNREALLPALETTFAARPRAHWLALLAAHDIPAAPVQPLTAFLEDPAVRHHGMVREYDHPEVGRLTLRWSTECGPRRPSRIALRGRVQTPIAAETHH